MVLVLVTPHARRLMIAEKGKPLRPPTIQEIEKAFIIVEKITSSHRTPIREVIKRASKYLRSKKRKK
jgi:hypothetical protein